jgi:CHAT domain-containing protein
MKKVLFDLGQDERNRILEMHQTATKKQYLMEDNRTGDELLLLEIISIIERITDRTDIDLASLAGEDRKMYMKIGDLENNVTSKLLPKYDIYNINSSGWNSLVDMMSNPSSNVGSLSGVSEFINELRSLIKNEFPSIELDEIKENLNQFNETLNKLTNN